MDATSIHRVRRDTLVLLSGIIVCTIFTALIWITGGQLNRFRATLLEDQGFSWYYWKLPDPNIWTQSSAWLSYAVHQVLSWLLIFRAQRKKLKYASASLHQENVLSLILHTSFALWHLLQTHLFYDGLAQDVPVWSPQFSVIVILVVIIIMENDRRGVFFGYRAPLPTSAVQLMKKYHGFYFSWATVYTFWFHPCETTSGHLLGFFYTYLLLLQGSIFFTRAHLNNWWKLSLELVVIVHGSLVAYYQAGIGGFWPMFFLGFSALFVITQMHGLNISYQTKWLIFGVYLAMVLVTYNIRGWSKLEEPLRIPFIDYSLVFVLSWLTVGGLKLSKRLGSLSGGGGLTE